MTGPDIGARNPYGWTRSGFEQWRVDMGTSVGILSSDPWIDNPPPKPAKPPRGTGVMAGKLPVPSAARSTAGGPVASFAKPTRPPQGHRPRMMRPHQRGQGPK
jgi:hypothetical protein